ncbi:MAG TPA: acyltransferase family protein [Bdellovibrionales bacterium]|nr:acyltransferase family protein [Bdellovibrionales bacterium]
MRYRPEIDGLRALAVLPVMLFHAAVPAFSGGYVGVDVFFVVSGYLITSLLLEDLEAGRFTYLGFLERRARRILPALFLVLLVCIPAAWLLLLPGQLREFSQSLIATIAFASNFYFRRETGYFEDAAEAMPLLHTWSLAVEEQYYIFYPVLLLAVWRLSKRTVWLPLAVFAAASIVLAEGLMRIDSGAAFFLAPARAWEFLLGAITASLRARQEPRNARFGNDALAATGLALILAPVFLYDGATRFPGANALAPVFGAVLIIWNARPGTLTGRVLSTRPLVGLGLLSYSLYLWHQPLLAFARVVTAGDVGLPLTAFALLLSLPLAYLSWRFIESPFRRPEAVSAKAVLAVSAGAVTVVGGLGLAGHFGLKDESLTDWRRVNHGLNELCEFRSRFEPVSACVTSSKPKYLVWGDSTAMALVPGLLASRPGVGLAQATRSVCGPHLELAPVMTEIGYGREWPSECLAFNQSVLEYLAATPSVEVVILSGKFGKHVVSPERRVSRAGVEQTASLSAAHESLAATVAAIRKLGKRVVIIKPPPRGRFDAGLCLERRAQAKPTWGVRSDCAIDRLLLGSEAGFTHEFFETLPKAIGPVADFDSALCDRRWCRTEIDGTFIYRDAGHFSIDGSIEVGRRMRLLDLIDGVAR